eukprot:TRINITY_DN67920_c8_g6_i1.p1 TRINITY_DN67920_c8_g6~~TRINITY_DN67920_c8_g6_i1.p1  ORF type:complete len:144 (-),score=5.41 TRINITY_DN67920_c8_g6_i1:184-615(-)
MDNSLSRRGGGAPPAPPDLAALGGLGGLGALGGMPGLGPGSGGLPGGMGTIASLLGYAGIVMFVVKNFLAVSLGYLLCFVSLMLWYGPKGITYDIAPYACGSILLIALVGCGGHAVEKFKSRAAKWQEKRVKDNILHHAPDVD